MEIIEEVKEAKNFITNFIVYLVLLPPFLSGILIGILFSSFSFGLKKGIKIVSKYDWLFGEG